MQSTQDWRESKWSGKRYFQHQQSYNICQAYVEVRNCSTCQIPVDATLNVSMRACENDRVLSIADICVNFLFLVEAMYRTSMQVSTLFCDWFWDGKRQKIGLSVQNKETNPVKELPWDESRHSSWQDLASHRVTSPDRITPRLSRQWQLIPCRSKCITKTNKKQKIKKEQLDINCTRKNKIFVHRELVKPKDRKCLGCRRNDTVAHHHVFSATRWGYQAGTFPGWWTYVMWDILVISRSGSGFGSRRLKYIHLLLTES